MDAFNILKNKLESEIDEFRKSYDNMDVIKTYNDWYIIGFKEAYFDVLTSDLVQNKFDTKEFEWLASLEKPLSFLYEKWTHADGDMNHSWDFIIDFVRSVYFDEKRQQIQNLYYDVKSMDINVVRNASDEFFDKFDFYTHVSHNPHLFNSKLHVYNDNEIDKLVAAFFDNSLLVKSCEYGCDTYPGGVSILVSPGNEQTYQQPVWNFIKDVEQMFECKCSYYNEVNGFEFVFEFGEKNNKGCYVFAAGNNGQEFCQGLYFTNPEQIFDAEFIKVVTTIDKALYNLLEKHDLYLENEEKFPLDSQIESAESLTQDSNESANLNFEKTI